MKPTARHDAVHDLSPHSTLVGSVLVVCVGIQGTLGVMLGPRLVLFVPDHLYTLKGEVEDEVGGRPPPGPACPACPAPARQCPLEMRMESWQRWRKLGGFVVSIFVAPPPIDLLTTRCQEEGTTGSARALHLCRHITC